MTESEFQDWASDDKEYKAYIIGATDSFSLINIQLEQQGLKRLFCQPKELVLSIDTYLQMLRKHLDMFGDNKTDNRYLTNIILLNSLKSTFPCSTH